MWRPADWNNTYSTHRAEDGMLSDADLYEAGADAMLKALRKQAVAFTHNGHLVFIPEEK